VSAHTPWVPHRRCLRASPRRREVFGREGRCSAPSCPALTSRRCPQHGQRLVFYCPEGNLGLGDFGNNLPGVLSKNELVLLHLSNDFGNPTATVQLGFLPCWYELAGHWCKSGAARPRRTPSRAAGRGHAVASELPRGSRPDP